MIKQHCASFLLAFVLGVTAIPTISYAIEIHTVEETPIPSPSPGCDNCEDHMPLCPDQTCEALPPCIKLATAERLVQFAIANSGKEVESDRDLVAVHTFFEERNIDKKLNSYGVVNENTNAGYISEKTPCPPGSALEGCKRDTCAEVGNYTQHTEAPFLEAHDEELNFIESIPDYCEVWKEYSRNKVTVQFDLDRPVTTACRSFAQCSECDATLRKTPTGIVAEWPTFETEMLPFGETVTEYDLVDTTTCQVSRRPIAETITGKTACGKPPLYCFSPKVHCECVEARCGDAVMRGISTGWNLNFAHTLKHKACLQWGRSK